MPHWVGKYRTTCAASDLGLPEPVMLHNPCSSLTGFGVQLDQAIRALACALNNLGVQATQRLELTDRSGIVCKSQQS